MNMWIISLIIGAIVIAAFVGVTALSGSVTKETVQCKSCGNACTAEKNCGLESCGAVSGGTCNCGK
jgi:hypothetical protein